MLYHDDSNVCFKCSNVGYRLKSCCVSFLSDIRELREFCSCRFMQLKYLIYGLSAQLDVLCMLYVYIYI